MADKEKHEADRAFVDTQMKPICHSMMNVHSKRHHVPAMWHFIFSPGNDWCKKFTLIKNMNMLFKSYIENMRIVMSLTVEIDVTNLIEFSKRNNLKFYPSMIWIVSKVVNTHDEFKYSWNDTGDLIKWNFFFYFALYIFITSVKCIYQFLYLIKKSTQMKPICHSMMNVQQNFIKKMKISQN